MRKAAFENIGNYLSLPDGCASIDELKKYILHPEATSDDEDDVDSMIDGTVTRFVTQQPLWRSDHVSVNLS